METVIFVIVLGWLGFEYGQERQGSAQLEQLVKDQNKIISECYQEITQNESEIERANQERIHSELEAQKLRDSINSNPDLSGYLESPIPTELVEAINGD